MGWVPADIPDLTGRRAIVTGANAGLGLEVAHGLAAHGAEVVLACRNTAKAETAAVAIRERTRSAAVAVGALDLADLDSVAAFAAGRSGRRDLRVNNAGLMAIDEARTREGAEMQFGVNHLGHFALTARLLPLLLATPGSRVATMSSMGHRAARGPGDPRLERRYDRWQAYFHSKLANLLFTAELQRRLAAADASTIAVAAHPGASNTDLGTEGSGFSNWGLRLLPASPHLFDAVLRLPLMDCTRARVELGWRPEHSAPEVLEEFLEGLRGGEGEATEPMRGRKAA